MGEAQTSNNTYSLTYQVLSYLVKNPKAEDTLEGVLQWWLLQERIGYEMKRVKQALEELAVRNFVTEVNGPENRIFYRINEAQRNEIEAFLEQFRTV
jgi:DNA-binding MarR family transcriptional regulator